VLVNVGSGNAYGEYESTTNLCSNVTLLPQSRDSMNRVSLYILKEYSDVLRP